MTRRVALIGVPCGHGGPHRGAALGPAALRAAGLRFALERGGASVVELGDVDVPEGEAPEAEGKLRCVSTIVEVARAVARKVELARARALFPLVFGGDHSIALGSITASAKHRRLGLIWVDAHADFNTEQTTITGNIHGMPLAAVVGFGDVLRAHLGHGKEPIVRAENTVLLGVREFDPCERRLLDEAGVTTLTLSDMKKNFEGAVSRAISIASSGTDGVHLSFDLDAIDPTHATGVSTPVPDGLTVESALDLCGAIARETVLLSADIAELNPLLDHDQATARLAVQIARAVVNSAKSRGQNHEKRNNRAVDNQSS